MDLIGSLLGGAQPGNLAKLQILVEKTTVPLTFDEANPITAHYNPTQLTIVKNANWRLLPTRTQDTGQPQFTHGEPAVLTVTLLFDTYETGVDVRKNSTQRVYDLLTVATHGEFHRPPICQLKWGEFGEFFQGVLQTLNQTFTLFLPNGTPVRATLTCTFREWISDEEEKRRQNQQSSDVAKTRVVRRGDSLSSIAGEEYHDVTLWRPIAEANGIDDPRALQPGQTLTIPVLNTRTTGGR